MGRFDYSELDNPSLGNILEEKARRDPAEVVLLFEDQKITSAEFNEQANRAANGLLRIGVTKGDKVCLCLPNCLEWLYLWFGMAKIGAVLVPLMPGLTSPYLAHMLGNSDAETLVTHASLLGMFDAPENLLETMKTVVVDIKGAPAETTDIPTDAVILENLVKSSPAPPRVEVGYPDMSHIVYTSGTTGLPKGVVIRHPAPVPKSERLPDQYRGLKSGEVIYTCYPIHTWFGGLLDCLSICLAVAFSREQRIETFWDDIRKYNASGFHYWADLIPALMNQPEKPDDRDNPARLCTGIMAPRDPEVLSAFEKRFGVKVIETYGSIESGDGAINCDGKPGSIGKPPDHVEVRIVDDQDNEMGPNLVGEIVMRHKSGEPITVEYYKMPEASAAKTRDGWFHTEDLAYKDDEGYLYFVDRKLDVIRKDGREIFASTIEKIVSQHPSVSECAAVGVPRGLTDDDIKLCVICKEGTSVKPEDLLAFCKERFEAHMVPRYIEFLDVFPRSSRGKVQRHKLRAEGTGPRTWDRHGPVPKGQR